MKMKRFVCAVICIALLVGMTACGVQDCTEKPGETQQGQSGGQGSTQGGVQMQRPLTVDFDSIVEIKQFFSANETLSEGEEITVSKYHSEDKAETLSLAAREIYLPIAKEKENTPSASWSPSKEHLTIIYIVDNIQYRFIYFFADHYPWVDDNPVAEDVQMGPYTLDFKTGEPGPYGSCVSGGLQIEGTDVYLRVRVAGAGVEYPNFDDFDFVPLSFVGGDVFE